MNSTEWETPQDFFDNLNDEFHFTIDVCATPINAKCERFYSLVEDGLKQDWSNEVFWMNPPYGRGVTQRVWVEKAYQMVKRGAIGVCLLPSATDTKIWHEYVMRSSEIRFIKDRLHFRLDGHSQRANHASVVVVFRPNEYGDTDIYTIDNKGRPYNNGINSDFSPHPSRSHR